MNSEDIVRVTKFAVLAAVFLLPGALFTLKPAAEFRNQSSEQEAASLADPPAPKATTHTLNLDAPLGMLVLDVSGSMRGWNRALGDWDLSKANDPDFIQTLASEAFAYFFAHQMMAEARQGGARHTHLSVMMYPALPGDAHKGCRVINWDDKGMFLPLFPRGDATDIPSSLQKISARLRSEMGDPANDLRVGMLTPHKDAIDQAVAVAEAYRKLHPAAPIYSVFMTDEEKPEFRQQANELTKFTTFSTAVAIKDRTECERMLPEFLKALDLEEKDATADFKSTGYTLRASDRPVPVVILSDGRPQLSSGSSQDTLDVLGRDGIFYTVLDPSLICGKSSAAKVRVTSPGVKQVLVFTRGAWLLQVSPAVVKLADPKPAKVTLAYTGTPKEQLPATQVCRLLDETGLELGLLDLQRDPASDTPLYQSDLEHANEFEAAGGSRFALECQVQGVKGMRPVCRAEFSVAKVLRLRFYHRDESQSGATIDRIPLYPEP